MFCGLCCQLKKLLKTLLFKLAFVSHRAIQNLQSCIFKVRYGLNILLFYDVMFYCFLTFLMVIFLHFSVNSIVAVCFVCSMLLTYLFVFSCASTTDHVLFLSLHGFIFHIEDFRIRALCLSYFDNLFRCCSFGQLSFIFVLLS